MEGSNKLFELDIHVSEFEKKKMQENYQCYFIMYNKLDGKNFRCLYESEKISARDMTFSKVKIPSLDLCLNDFDKEIKIEFYKFYIFPKGSPILIGQYVEKLKNVFSNLNESSAAISLNSEDNYLNLSSICVGLNESQIPPKEFFEDNDLLSLIKKHILSLIKKHNLAINLIIAIDFTSSNEQPYMIKSKHYRYGTNPNPYKKAIISMVDLVGEFDSDNRFPAYGFGAEIKETGKTSFCFNINMDEDNPYIEGKENLIRAYDGVFEFIELSGLTYFAEFLKKILQDLESEKDKNNPKLSQQNYQILLILTDGNIDDMEKTTELVVKLSHHPISIIIVGIGNSLFENMIKLGNQ